MIDTNILVRCVQGRAMRRVHDLVNRGVAVSTTDVNAHELWGVLTGKLKVDEGAAAGRIADLLVVVEPIGWDRYAYLRGAAEARLREGGKKDWPALAAAMALEAHIWSDDNDYLGVGIPVWSTPNVQFAPADRQI